MDVAAARGALGLEPGATMADAEAAYKALRKPLLKELNQHEAGKEPPQLVRQSERLETAIRVLRELAAARAGSPIAAAKQAIAKQASAKQAAAQEASADGEAPATGDGAAEDAADADVEGDGGKSETGSTTGTGRLTTRMVLDAGTLVGDRYEIQRLLSHRPEGDTYRARDRVRGTEVALKVLDSTLVREMRHRTMIRQSITAAGRVHHANIARVLDVFAWDPTMIVVQELPAGENVWERLYGDAKGTKSLTPERVLNMARGATRGLAALHDVMPHGALRPESLWMGDAGEARVSDYGFASLQAPLRERRLSRAKLGTAYWAPEQYRDDPIRAEKSDQYALALVLYEILSGKPAVGRTGKLRQFTKAYPRRFTRAVERALSSKPARRFADMDAFGEAAFSGYTSERAAPAGVSWAAVALPVALLLAVFAAFVFSPLGRGSAEGMSNAIGRWQLADAAEASAEIEWRRLRALAARLDTHRAALGEDGSAELARIGKELDKGIPPAADRSRLNEELAGVVGKIVATSGREAEEARRAALAALDRIESLARERTESATAALEEAQRALAGAPRDARLSRIMDVARRQALLAQLPTHVDRARAATTNEPTMQRAWRGLLDAEAALAVGDESTAGRAFGVATLAFNEAASAGEKAADELAAWEPLREDVGAPQPLDERQRRDLFDVFVESAASLAADEESTRTLEALRANATAGAGGRWLVDAFGAWALDAACGPRSIALGGVWRVEGTETPKTLLLVTVVDDRVLAQPIHVETKRTGEAPGPGDFVAALGELPRPGSATWSVRSTQGGLPLPVFESARRVVRAGEVVLRGQWPGNPDAAIVAERKRFDVAQGGFTSTATVSGDVLRSHVRAHGATGLVSGPGAFLQLHVDGLLPRIHLLEPTEGVPIAAGSEVVVRAIVYDSNLTSVNVGGTEAPVHPDDVYILVERRLVAPSKGTLALPATAADAAGNVASVEWKWPIR